MIIVQWRLGVGGWVIQRHSMATEKEEVDLKFVSKDAVNKQEVRMSSPEVTSLFFFFLWTLWTNLF